MSKPHAEKRLIMTRDDGMAMMEAIAFLGYLKRESVFDFSHIPFDEIVKLCKKWAESGRKEVRS